MTSIWQAFHKVDEHNVGAPYFSHTDNDIDDDNATDDDDDCGDGGYNGDDILLNE